MLNKKEIRIIIEEYFKSLENADAFICGCGCNNTIDFTHGQAQRHKKDLIEIFT